MKSPSKTYLGDGLYADFDGYHIILTAENGISVQNTVYLEDTVYEALKRYAEYVWDPHKAEVSDELPL